MFVLIWVLLLLFVGGSSANASASMRPITRCYSSGRFCITLPDGLITAEAGLCVVIPCSFIVGRSFTPQHLVWFKCDPSKEKCEESDRIFVSYKYYDPVQPGFRGRVSLLESDVRRLNCSIVVNDLKKSDSGAYQLRVEGVSNNRADRFLFSPRASISVKGLEQKPTLEVPLMRAGEEATLTCTAPGLCSGSRPGFSWTWSGAGGIHPHIPRNITDSKTEDLTAVARRHSSTLTFNSSAELHGVSITCKVSLAGGVTAEETATLNVTHLKEVEISGNTSVKEGEALSLTCSVESFPPSRVTWMKVSEPVAGNGSETNVLDEALTASVDETESSQQEDVGKSSFFIPNVTAGDSGPYVCRVKYDNITLTKRVDVTVNYNRKPRIIGSTSVKRRDTLNLACSAQSFPPSLVMWTKLGDNETMLNSTGSAVLVIPNVTAEDSGRYICTVIRQGATSTLYADVAVIWIPDIQRSSTCAVQSGVLTCSCISNGSPLPTIRWPMLQGRSEYSFITTVSSHTVNSTVSMTVGMGANQTVECVSGNENGEVKESLPIQMKPSQQVDQSSLGALFRLEVILAFVIGVLLSAFICCSAFICYRGKQKSSGKSNETVELVPNHSDPEMYYGQAVQDDQEEAEHGTAAAEKSSPELNNGHKNVDYASIDFSQLKRKRPVKSQEDTETEYAEIKKQAKEESADEGGEESDMLEGKEEEEATVEVETEQLAPEEDGGEAEVEVEAEAEAEAVYSNVKDVMRNI